MRHRPISVLRSILLSAGLSVLAHVAAAQAPASPNFKITVGGDAYFEAGFVDQKRDAGLRSSEFRNRLRLVITPLAKTDSGLEYGARLRLRANGNDRVTDADRAFVFAQGSFGKLRGGVQNGLDDEVDLFMQAPLDWRVLVLHNQPLAYIGGGTSGADLPFSKTGFDWNDFNTIENNATKIAYYSPRAAGFQAAVDFTPRNDSNNTDVNRSKTGTGSAASTSIYQNLLEAGINFDDRIGPLALKAFVSTIVGSAVDTPSVSYNDLRAWHIGGQIGLGVWSAGAGYMDVGKSGLSKAPATVSDRTRNLNAGFQYNDTVLAAGFQYQYGQDAGNLSIAGKRVLNSYTAGALYTIAPGLSVGGEYTWFHARSDMANRDDQGSVALLHTVLVF